MEKLNISIQYEYYMNNISINQNKFISNNNSSDVTGLNPIATTGFDLFKSSSSCIEYLRLPGFIIRGESPGCRLISAASMLEWLGNLLPHQSQGSSTKRWRLKYPGGGHCQSV